jgi:hypothetical protein
MDMIEATFVPTVFSHNRDRLIVHDVAGEFLRAIVGQARKAKLMSADHFTVGPSGAPLVRPGSAPPPRSRAAPQARARGA